MMKFNKKNIKIAALVLFGMMACFLIAVRLPDHVAAVSTSDVTNTVNKLINGNDQGSSSKIVDTFVIMTLLSIIPLILIMTTSFTRIIVVLSFVRSSLGTQQNPPNQVLIGLALFLTLFTRSLGTARLSSRRSPAGCLRTPFSSYPLSVSSLQLLSIIANLVNGCF